MNGAKITIIPVEATAAPNMTRGKFTYDYGDVAGLTPLLAMYTLGHRFVPPPIHAGGLRYHGMAPLVSAGVAAGLLEPRAYDQVKCYEAAMTWARTEGFIAAPETSHAIAAVIDEAQKAKAEGKERVILFNYSGHGLLDLAGYDKYMRGALESFSLPEEDLQESIESLKDLPKIKG
jgi:tryptophan synthase beta chain